MHDPAPRSAPRPALTDVAVVAADRRVRESLASVLAATGRVQVVWTAADQRAALACVALRRPTVVVLDARADGSGGSELLGSLREQAPGARILVVEWDGAGDLSLAAGVADGVLDASALPGALFAALGVPATD
jgi:DNA-binding NarL/FixJ family response regulator